MARELKSLSEVRQELDLARDPIKLAELVNRPIVVENIRDWVGDYGPTYTIDLTLNGERYFCVTSAQVVTEKLLEVAEYLPLRCEVVDRGQYYDIQ